MKDFLKVVKQNKIIVIVRGIESEKILPLFNALYSGGVRLAEITFGVTSDDQTAADIALAKNNFGDKMLVGAGTVTNINRAQCALNAGADYIISPVCDCDVIRFAVNNNLPCIAGAFTPTEIKTAYDNGADLVKVFPAEVLGPAYLKSVSAPLNYIPLVPFGGITAENIKDYCNVGAAAVGVGAAIIDKKSILSGDFKKIENNAKNLFNIINS